MTFTYLTTGTTDPKIPDKFDALLSLHIYRDEDGKQDIEVLNWLNTDNYNTEIFCDIEQELNEHFILDPDQDEDYFMAHVRSWFEPYYDYFDGPQCDIESEITKIEDLLTLQKLLMTLEVAEDLETTEAEESQL